MGDVNHLRVTYTGKRKSADYAGEFWQFGFHMLPTLGAPITDTGAPPMTFDAVTDSLSDTNTNCIIEGNFLLEGGVNDINPVDYLNDQCRVAIKDYLNGGSIFPLDVYCESIEVWPIGSDGKVLGDLNGPFKATLNFTTTTEADGTTTGTSYAPFTSFAVSTRTPANTPRGRGRWYPPSIATAFVGTDTGLMGSTARATYLTWAEQFMQTQSLTDNVNNVYIRPVVIGSPFSTAYPINRLEVDNIPDTQRRRKNQVTSQRSSLAMTF